LKDHGKVSRFQYYVNNFILGHLSIMVAIGSMVLFQLFLTSKWSFQTY